MKTNDFYYEVNGPNWFTHAQSIQELQELIEQDTGVLVYNDDTPEEINKRLKLAGFDWKIIKHDVYNPDVWAYELKV